MYVGRSCHGGPCRAVVCWVLGSSLRELNKVHTNRIKSKH